MSRPTRIATIDVGTNTALLLIADIHVDGTITPLHEAERFVRLGAGVDATGRVGEAALARLREALTAYQAVVQAYGVAQILIAATSASRDATNKADLVDFVRYETGLAYDIISGEEEAALSFLGAVSAFDDLAGPCAMLDIGGGSTEIVLGAAGGTLAHRRSLNVGSVRLTERFFSSAPPVLDEVDRAIAYIHALLDTTDLELDDTAPLIGVDGTPVSLALVRAGVASWSALGSGPVVLTATEVRFWCQRLMQMPTDAIRTLSPAVMTGRADVFAAAVLILDTILDRYSLPACRVSPRGLRHGLALRFAQQQALR